MSADAMSNDERWYTLCMVATSVKSDPPGTARTAAARTHGATVWACTMSGWKSAISARNFEKERNGSPRKSMR